MQFELNTGCESESLNNSWKVCYIVLCIFSMMHMFSTVLLLKVFPYFFVATLLLHRGLVNVSPHKTITGAKIIFLLLLLFLTSFPARTWWRQTSVYYSYQPQGRVTSDLL